jgi:glycerophosphoryl diester phosphodiesterase
MLRAPIREGALMWDEARGVVTDAFRDLLRRWRSLALTDIAYKLVAFAVLTPVTALLLRWLLSRTDTRVVADADIARFFLTTPPGIVALVAGGAILLAISTLGSACLMAIGLATAKGLSLNARGALALGSTRALDVLRLAANMVVRLLGRLVPFVVAVGLVYWGLLRQHDINYYLSARPPEFLTAVALVALLAAGLVVLLVWTITRWALALPLLLFENVRPGRALLESVRRSLGKRALVAMVLGIWAVVALALAAVAASVPELIGRILAPHFASSLPLLLLFIAGLALLWVALGLAAAIVNISLFSLLIVRLYLHVGEPAEPRLPAAAVKGLDPDASRRLSGVARAGLAVLAVLVATGFALLAFLLTRSNQAVLVIAHRGASAVAPENTLAAFRLAAEQGANFVELDVQESKDGQVLVNHDSDLMKTGRSAMKIWENDAAQLRSVDIGSHAGRQFSEERVPTLAEVLAACKGKARVIVELKSYGHDQRLEERVVEIVEAAGMEKNCLFMSLNHGMVSKMKQLRPSWRCGVLVAKALGDLTALNSDFLAVEARLATARFVRRAHRAGQDVYVWTVNDPAWMLAAMSHGADGLITDKPDLALQVVARRAQMSDTQRLLLALLIRLGAQTKALEAEDALRP